MQRFHSIHQNILLKIHLVENLNVEVEGWMMEDSQWRDCDNKSYDWPVNERFTWRDTLWQPHRVRHPEALCNRTKNTNYCRASSVEVPCVLCKQPQNLAKATTWKMRKGMKRGKNWQVDFSKLPRQESYQYVLVLVGMFRPEAFP